MNETTPPLPPESSAAPFGAGVPAEPVETVRLPSGLRHGPALDIRGQVAPPPQPARSPAFEPTAPPVQPVPPVRSVPPPAAPAATSPDASRSAEPSRATTVAHDAGVPPSYAGAAAGAPPSSTPPPPGPVPPPASGLPPIAPPKGRWWIGFAHLLFLVPSAPFPFGVLATALIWIWRREKDPLMADQGREAINMQMTFWIAIALLGISCAGHALIPFVYVLGAVLCVLAAISAGGGERHRYPWVFRFLK